MLTHFRVIDEDIFLQFLSMGQTQSDAWLKKLVDLENEERKANTSPSPAAAAPLNQEIDPCVQVWLDTPPAKKPRRKAPPPKN